MSLTALFAAMMLVFAVPSVQSGALDELAWLEGEWQRQTRSGPAIERWERDGNAFVGEGLVTRGSETVSIEALLLVEIAGEVYYIAKPPENPYPVAFRLVSTDDGAFVFENTTHDFPQRIIYRRIGDDGMVAAIEGPGQADGEPQRIEFSFTRR